VAQGCFVYFKNLAVQVGRLKEAVLDARKYVNQVVGGAFGPGMKLSSSR
jgi:hypothetical protein